MRMVVVLRDVYDLPHEAIARELGISQTAAKVRLHRARRRLRDQLFVPAGTPGVPSRSRQRQRVPAGAGARTRAHGRLEVDAAPEVPAQEAERRATAV